MFVFIHGDGTRPAPELHFMFVTPGGHLENTELPISWVDSMNRPKTFELRFVGGRAEVDDQLGSYLIKNGLAKESGAPLFRL